MRAPASTRAPARTGASQRALGWLMRSASGPGVTRTPRAPPPAHSRRRTRALSPRGRAPPPPRPSQLDGKRYASYGARYEGRIVQEVIRRDGGKGEYAELTPPMLDIWGVFLKVAGG